MKLWLLVGLLVLTALVYFRSGRRWGHSSRGNLISLFIFLLMLGGMFAMLYLVVKLF